MKSLKNILTCLTLLLSLVVNGQNDQSDTTIFHIGNGIRDTYIRLTSNGQISTYFSCDICPGEETFGTFKISGDTLFKRFTQLAKDKNGYISFGRRVSEEQLKKDLGEELFKKLKENTE